MPAALLCTQTIGVTYLAIICHDGSSASVLLSPFLMSGANPGNLKRGGGGGGGGEGGPITYSGQFVLKINKIFSKKGGGGLDLLNTPVPAYSAEGVKLCLN